MLVLSTCFQQFAFELRFAAAMTQTLLPPALLVSPVADSAVVSVADPDNAQRLKKGLVPLSISRPDIAAEWHRSLNGALTPEMVSAGSNKFVWWQCSKSADHVYERSIHTRTDRRRPPPCPFCSGRMPDKSQSLMALYPDIAKEWHPKRAT